MNEKLEQSSLFLFKIIGDNMKLTKNQNPKVVDIIYRILIVS